MGGLLFTALTVGLLGGVHCVAMCGGIVGAYALKQAPRAPSPASQLAFNAGRIGSYVLAGTIAGGLSAGGMALVNLLPLQTMLFVAANGLLILLGLHLTGNGGMVLHLERAGRAIWPLIRTLARHAPERSTTAGRIALGAAWGWMPCGLVYSVLALALVSGSALSGAAVMLAFGLGTLPNLLGAGWLTQRLGARLKSPALRMAAGCAVAAFGIAGLIRMPHLAEQVREGLLRVGNL